MLNMEVSCVIGTSKTSSYLTDKLLFTMSCMIQSYLHIKKTRTFFNTSTIILERLSINRPIHFIGGSSFILHIPEPPITHVLLTLF
jgi:hypothetical protein